MNDANRMEFLKRAAEHSAASRELLSQISAIHSYVDQNLIEPEQAFEEVLSLSQQFEIEMENAIESYLTFLNRWAALHERYESES